MSHYVEPDLSKINIDLDKALRDAASEPIAPDGFHAQKIDNMQRFLGKWPKTFPPIEPNTPIYWLVDLLSTMITEHQMEPLKKVTEERLDGIVADQISPYLKKMDDIIEKVVASRVEAYFKKEIEKETITARTFADELEGL